MKNDNSEKRLNLFFGSSSEGRRSDAKIRSIIERFLLPIEIIHWRQIFPSGIFNLEALLKTLPKIDAALFIATPDDETKYRGKIKPQPRDNIIFEFGLCMGKLGRKRVSMVLVERNGQFPKLPSDLEGLGLIRCHQDGSGQFEIDLEDWISSIISKNKLEKFDDDEPVEEGEESIEVAEEEVMEDDEKDDTIGNDESDASAMGVMEPEKPKIGSSDNTSEQVSEEPPDKDIRDNMVEISPEAFIVDDGKTDQAGVAISRPFFMDIYPVTQALYQEIMNKNPSKFKGEDLPVESISWFDAIDFCNELSKQSGLDQVYEWNDKEVKINYEKNGYRLPTEAEWEYACRGKPAEECYGELDGIAWYLTNSGKQTQAVGQKTANEFGLYEMLGNVWEWCNDLFDKNYRRDPQPDPKDPKRGVFRVVRGGSWVNPANIIRSTQRNKYDPYTKASNRGFRLVLPLNQQLAEEL